MSWHYLAVRKRQGVDWWVEIHEIYLDRAGRIDLWTENPRSVGGNDLDDLVLGLRHMLYDVVRWGVVEEAALRAGARLTPRRSIASDAPVHELISALRSLGRTRDLHAELVGRLLERQVRRRRRGGRAGRRRIPVTVL
jgi:hypothetical protein